MLRVTVLCSDPDHPVNAWLERWLERNRHRAEIAIVRDRADCTGGDFLFLISCHQIIGADVRARYGHTLVIHASDLPKGRGWSPMAWEVLNGADSVTVSLLNAEDGVDSGDIWQKRRFALEGTELLDELNATNGNLPRVLSPEKAKAEPLVSLDEKAFRWAMNEDAMATEKTAEGIRLFSADIVKLEQLLAQKRGVESRVSGPGAARRIARSIPPVR